MFVHDDDDADDIAAIAARILTVLLQQACVDGSDRGSFSLLSACNRSLNVGLAQMSDQLQCLHTCPSTCPPICPWSHSSPYNCTYITTSVRTPVRRCVRTEILRRGGRRRHIRTHPLGCVARRSSVRTHHVPQACSHSCPSTHPYMSLVARHDSPYIYPLTCPLMSLVAHLTGYSSVDTSAHVLRYRTLRQLVRPFFLGRISRNTTVRSHVRGHVPSYTTRRNSPSCLARFIRFDVPSPRELSSTSLPRNTRCVPSSFLTSRHLVLPAVFRRTAAMRPYPLVVSPLRGLRKYVNSDPSLHL